METETLSSYERPQDKHILNDGLNVNIPNHDNDSNSLDTNEVNEAESDTPIEPVSSSSKKDTEGNCDETVSSSENKIDGDNLGNENVDTNLNKSINSPNVSSTNYEEEEERDNLNNEEPEETSLTNDERKLDSLNKELNESVENVSDSGSGSTKNGLPESEENVDENLKTTEDKNELTDPLESNEKDNDDSKSEVNSTNEGDKEVVKENERENGKDTEKTQEEEKEKENEEAKENEKEEEKEAETVDDKKKTTKEKTAEGNDFPLLKETLTKKSDDGAEDKEEENENANEEIDMDDDFDPSLLCPDIAMEVDEAPVITTTDILPSDGNKSPLLYEPVYSTYVDEMTGAEVTFNLSPEEQQLRQDTYGEKNPIQFTKIHCTACNVHLGSALDGQGNRFVHPLLKVLICKDCYHFYTSGEFEKDEDGSELYCRWCGQGGQVMCCSSCEMVFCKKCIRINFGRKKLTEIRDSDDWYCFRCNPAQLIQLRVHCAEFMEYVRREISRAATLENATSFTTTDYTQCCLSQKKKYVDPNANEQPKKRRKKWVDPDYDPTQDRPETPKLNNSLPDIKPTPTKVVPILPKTTDSNVGTGTVTSITQSYSPGTVFKVGNTTFRPRVSTFTQVRPTLQTVTSTAAVRSSGPGYIKIMPSGIRSAPRQPAQTFVSSSVRPQSFQQRQVRPMNPTMKHEWFEKTVRAAARVNSNLSYTLTQLNRAQATAGSVEALAVVHNKLQEILSTSINSLIQIRKNLRTEFISGIKNIRFPPKPTQSRPQPSTSSQDDDVIFISPTSSPVPAPLSATTTDSLIATNNLTPSVSLINTSPTTKKPPVVIVPTTTLQPIPSTSGEKPKVFLRVKSLSSLQSVPSECITIPDDPIPPPPLAELTPKDVPKFEEIMLVEDSPSKANGEVEIVNEENEKRKTVDLTDDGKDDLNSTEDLNGKETSANDNGEKIVESSSGEEEHLLLPDLSKLLKIKICLQRSEEIDELVRNKFGLVNGGTSD